MKLRDQVALITGAGQGIGHAAARRLFAEGASVVLTDVSVPAARAAAAQLDSSGARAIGIGMDVSDAGQVQASVAQALHRFGRVDILVAAAGIYPARAFEEMDIDFWRKVMAVNLDGVFSSCRAVFPVMKQRGYGRIVTVASATVYKANATFSAYVASKGGVIALTRVLANEGGPFGITANVVAPGVVASEGMRARENGQAFLDSMIAAQPIKRGGQPDDIASAVAYLASPEAGFITGATLDINGGTVYR